MTGARARFERRLQRTYHQVIRARAEVEQMTELAAATRAKLADRDEDGEPMAHLARHYGLAPAQVELVWCAVACAVDPRIAPHLEALGGGHARRGLSPALYAMLAELDTAELARWLAAPNPLVDDGLLVPAEPASPAARGYLVAPRLVSFLAGEDHAIAPLALAAAPADPRFDAAQRASLALIAGALAHGAVVVLDGPLGSGRVTAAAHACGPVVVLDLARLPGDQLAGALVALRRERALRPAIPVLANVDHALGDDRRDDRHEIADFIDQLAGPLVITSTVPGVELGARRAVVRLRWDVASAEVRAALWRRAVEAGGGAVAGSLDVLAHRYRVGPAAIERAVASLRLVVPAAEPLDEAALAAGLRHNIAERLGGLATRIDVTQSWDDLVIADDTADLIAALVGRIRHAPQVLDDWGYRQKIARGAGVAALFSGPPGTGKTMVAGLIAQALDLELYQVDLSKVVSKWVGETEKHLARVFDAAEEGHALLLFDEADALFGQRSTEMAGAVDRYANLEVNYLLQRVEAFGGITILTTNLDSAIDAALKRRLAAHIVFAAPEEDERARLWDRQIVTGKAPIARDVDPDALARAFPQMTGAHIRNAAIAAAFLASGDGAPRITQDYLIRAARAEYRSMGHMVSESIAPRSAGRERCR
jgi:AAA+ superfamily predicted ATPase